MCSLAFSLHWTWLSQAPNAKVVAALLSNNFRSITYAVHRYVMYGYSPFPPTARPIRLVSTRSAQSTLRGEHLHDTKLADCHKTACTKLISPRVNLVASLYCYRQPCQRRLVDALREEACLRKVNQHGEATMHLVRCFTTGQRPCQSSGQGQCRRSRDGWAGQASWTWCRPGGKGTLRPLTL